MEFKKKLPHLEKPHAKYFITFVTWERLELTPAARQVVLECCKYFDNQRYKLYSNSHFGLKPISVGKT